jgi:hypothetical protein
LLSLLKTLHRATVLLEMRLGPEVKQQEWTAAKNG